MKTCNREALYERRTLCVTHYGRKKRTGDVQADIPIRERRHLLGPVNRIEGDICGVEDCFRLRAQMRGGRRKYCSGHIARLNKTGRLDAHIPLRPVHSGKIDEWCSYSTAHARVAAKRGKARDKACVKCGAGAVDWSYRGGAQHEFQGQVNGKYGLRRWSGDPADYDPMCRACHVGSDRTLEARDRRASDLANGTDMIDKDFRIAELEAEVKRLKSVIDQLQAS